MELSEFSDNQLVLLFRNGRRDAFAELFRRHRGMVHRIARRMVGAGPDAEEVLQDAFLRVARAASSYEAKARFSTWLYRIVVNRCLSFRARSGRGRLVALPERCPPDPAPGPYERARAGELKASLRREVAGLPDPLCAAFTVVVLEERPYAEAAEILEVPVGTVKTHVHRARLLLRRRLARELAAEPLPEGGVREC